MAVLIRVHHHHMSHRSNRKVLKCQSDCHNGDRFSMNQVYFLLHSKMNAGLREDDNDDALADAVDVRVHLDVAAAAADDDDDVDADDADDDNFENVHCRSLHMDSTQIA